ncbi:unnamed protein product, partial [Closterium sp. NIES-54]
RGEEIRTKEEVSERDEERRWGSVHEHDSSLPAGPLNNPQVLTLNSTTPIISPPLSAAPLYLTPLPPFLPSAPAPPTIVPAQIFTWRPAPSPPPPIPATSPPQQQPRERRGRAEGGAVVVHSGHPFHATSPPKDGGERGEGGADPLLPPPKPPSSPPSPNTRCGRERERRRRGGSCCS